MNGSSVPQWGGTSGADPFMYNDWNFIVFRQSGTDVKVFQLSANNGGQGASGGNNRNEAVGGRGGNGGDLGQFGEDGERGNGQRGERGNGGAGGHPGDSIRRKSGVNYNLYNNGTVKGPTSTGNLT